MSFPKVKSHWSAQILQHWRGTFRRTVIFDFSLSMFHCRWIATIYKVQIDLRRVPAFSDKATSAIQNIRKGVEVGARFFHWLFRLRLNSVFNSISHVILFQMSFCFIGYSISHVTPTNVYLWTSIKSTWETNPAGLRQSVLWTMTKCLYRPESWREHPGTSCSRGRRFAVLGCRSVNGCKRAGLHFGIGDI